MKVKIEFYRRCNYCLYETPSTQTLIWDNGDRSCLPIDFHLSEEDLAIMLEQMHRLNNIVCENCGKNDRLGFAVVKANDKIYNEYTNSNDGAYDDFADSDRVLLNEFEIHNKILKLTRTSYILFHLKDGSFMIAEVMGINTSYMDGSKSYFVYVYQKFEKLEEQLDLEDFYPDDIISHENIDLSEIAFVEHYLYYEDVE